MRKAAETARRTQGFGSWLRHGGELRWNYLAGGQNHLATTLNVPLIVLSQNHRGQCPPQCRNHTSGGPCGELRSEPPGTCSSGYDRALDEWQAGDAGGVVLYSTRMKPGGAER